MLAPVNTCILVETNFRKMLIDVEYLPGEIRMNLLANRPFGVSLDFGELVFFASALPVSVTQVNTFTRRLMTYPTTRNVVALSPGVRAVIQKTCLPGLTVQLIGY